MRPSPRHLLLPMILVLAACESEGPEQRLRATVEAMEIAAEAGDRGAFMDHVADDFSGQAGAFARRDLEQLLRVQLLRHTRVGASILSQDYTIYPGRARGELRVLLTGGPRSWLPDSGRIYHIETSWRADDETWTLIGAQWEPLGAGP